MRLNNCNKLKNPNNSKTVMCRPSLCCLKYFTVTVKCLISILLCIVGCERTVLSTDFMFLVIWTTNNIDHWFINNSWDIDKFTQYWYNKQSPNDKNTGITICHWTTRTLAHQPCLASLTRIALVFLLSQNACLGVLAPLSGLRNPWAPETALGECVSASGHSQ